jgi:hypothetical protein
VGAGGGAMVGAAVDPAAGAATVDSGLCAREMWLT